VAFDNTAIETMPVYGVGSNFRFYIWYCLYIGAKTYIFLLLFFERAAQNATSLILNGLLATKVTGESGIS
jgi:hypothetical protein